MVISAFMMHQQRGYSASVPTHLLQLKKAGRTNPPAHIDWLLRQQRRDKPFQHRQRHRPDLVLRDFPVRIDNHRHRQLRRAAQRLNHRARLVQRERHVELLLREELVHIVRHEVRVNRYQRDFVAVLRVQLRKIRQLCHARRTPCRQKLITVTFPFCADSVNSPPSSPYSGTVKSGHFMPTS